MSYTNPVLLKTLLNSLVTEAAGIAPSDITVYDVSRLFPDYMVEMCTDGVPEGVHEHWNNSTEKLYSRNLGEDEGIELVRLIKHL